MQLLSRLVSELQLKLHYLKMWRINQRVELQLQLRMYLKQLSCSRLVWMRLGTKREPESFKYTVGSGSVFASFPIFKIINFTSVLPKPIYCNWVVLSTSSVAVAVLLSGWFSTSLESATSTATQTLTYLKATQFSCKTVQLQQCKSCGKYNLKVWFWFYTQDKCNSATATI